MDLHELELLARVTEDAPHGVAVTDGEGRILYWNRTAQSVFGHTREQALGQVLSSWMLRPTSGVDRAVQAGAAPSQDAVGWQQAIARCADGSLRYVNVDRRRLQHADGGPLQVFNLADVTIPTVRRDARLLAARLGGLLDSVPDAIVIVNEIGRIVLVNQQAEHVFGYAPQELLGAALELLLPERLRGGHGEHRARYMAQPHARPMGAGLALLGLRKNGEEFPVEISLSPLESEIGHLAISAIRDITSRRMVERTLEEKNIELERANRAKDRFLATMSHELRTPLNAILGFTGLLLMRLPGPLTSEQEKQLAMVQSSGQHLLSLINDLLDLAKIDSGNVAVRLERVDARAIIEQVGTTLRPAAQARGLSLLLDLPEGDIAVQADARALQQILLNLTNNALKFTAEGQVCIGLDLSPALTQARELGISVQDTGVGMSPEEQVALFSAFTRVGSPGQQGRVEGTGLGLYLCRKLAELQQGRILLRSAPGQGSCFTLVLRRAEDVT